MAILFYLRKSIGSGLVFFSLLFFIHSFPVDALIQSTQLSQGEFRNKLIEAYGINDNETAVSLIRNNRLLVKPFVDGLVRECIGEELNGRKKESEKTKSILVKTAGSFESLFGEKSLSIAVNYLTTWSGEQKEKKLVADSIYALGTKYRLGKEPALAIECFQKAIQLYSRINDERGAAEVLGGFGAVYFNSYKDSQNSLLYYNKALIQREKVDDKQLIGATLNSLGSVYYSLMDYLESIRWFDKAEAIRTEIGDLANLKTTLTSKASALKLYSEKLNRSANYPEALAQAEKGLALFNTLNNKFEVGDVLSLMGFIYSNLGDNASAIGKLNEALKVMQEINDSVGIAGVYNHYGIVLQHVGRSEKAFEYYNNALTIYTDHNDLSGTIPVLGNLGTLFFDLKDYARAEDYHKRGLQISRDLKDTIVEIDYLLNLANDQIYLGKLEESMSSYKSAMEITLGSNMPDLKWKILVGMAENFKRRGEFVKAVEINDSALTLVESVRSTLKLDEFKSSYLAKERYVFEDIINLLCDLHEKFPDKGYDIRAFQYAERCKSRALLDLLTESPAGTKSPEPVSLKTVQEICPDMNTVFLEYIVGDSSSCLWVITKSQHQIFRLPSGKNLKDEIEALRFALLDPKQGASEFFATAGSSLYKELIRPAEPYLTKNSRLIIIPDGILNYLPFEVLLTEENAGTTNDSYAGLPFLVRKYPISYGQSASIMKSLLSFQAGTVKIKPGNRKLIAFGDPVYEGQGSVTIQGKKLRRLEYSGEEVEKIASLFKPGNSEIYLRGEATEENVRKEGNLARFNYLHFASHGYIDEDKPDLSSLILTKSDNSAEDGLLQSTEIFSLKLKTDLVVLSACQTGLGKLVRGEGIIGLTRAFMYAGTPSVLVSLWSVSDNSTSTLMEEFYRNLIRSGLNKTDALRKAQLALLSDEKTAHPFYWAPFVLVGDWR